MVYDPDNVFSLSSQGKGVYEISNAKDSMTVDTANDKLRSDKIEQFLYNDQREDPTSTTEYVFERIVDTDYSNFRNFELLDKIVTEHYE